MASVTSASSGGDSQSDPFNLWPFNRLVEFVAATLKSNKILKAETEMFKCYIDKIEPSKLKEAESQSKTTVGNTKSSADVTPNFKLGQKPTRSNLKSGQNQHFERLLKMRAEDKCDIAQKEFERLKEKERKFCEESQKIVDNHHAIIDEATDRITELKRDIYEFDRDVAKGCINHRNGKVYGEKVVRFFEDKMKAKGAYCSKMRLKSQALRQMLKKLALMLKQKEEVGDILTEIDFQQLKIENAERIEKIEDRNKDFFRLKTNGTVTTHVFNHYKRKLQKIMLESEQLHADIKSRNNIISKLTVESKYCEAERAKAETINKRQRQNLAMYNVPEVMEAVKLQAEVLTLNKDVAVWERKLKIADMAFTSQKKRWSKIKIQARESLDPFAQVLTPV